MSYPIEWGPIESQYNTERVLLRDLNAKDEEDIGKLYFTTGKLQMISLLIFFLIFIIIILPVSWM